MSRIDLAIRRYEEEIQNICRSNAELRASIQSKASPVRSLDVSESLQYTAPDVRKLQMRVQTLEDYVETLEDKLRNSTGSLKYDQSEEVTALRRTAAALSEENEALRAEVGSLKTSLKLTEQRLQSSDRMQPQSRELQETIVGLRAELARERQDKQQLITRCNVLQEQTLTPAESSFQESKPMRESAIASEEVSRYKALAQEKGEEKARVEKRLQDFMRESEEMQEDLKRRILVLESRQQHSSPEKPAAASKHRRTKRDTTPHARESRSKSASRSRPRTSSDYADVVHFSCPKCIRKHSKERLRKSISP